MQNHLHRLLERKIINKNMEILKNKGMKICAISSHNICYSCFDITKIPFSILRKPEARNWSAYNFRLDKIEKLTYLDYLKENTDFQVRNLSNGLELINEDRVYSILEDYKLGILSGLMNQ